MTLLQYPPPPTEASPLCMFVDEIKGTWRLDVESRLRAGQAPGGAPGVLGLPNQGRPTGLEPRSLPYGDQSKRGDRLSAFPGQGRPGAVARRYTESSVAYPSTGAAYDEAYVKRTYFPETQGGVMFLYKDYHEAAEPSKLMQIVDAAAADIKEWQVKQSTPVSHIAVCGASGHSVGWPVSYKLGIPVAIVRKKDEKSHGSDTVVGSGRMKDYVIVDDLISSGMTINYILATIARQAHAGGYDIPQCRAIFLHQSKRDKDFNPRDELGCSPLSYVQTTPIPVFGRNVSSSS